MKIVKGTSKSKRVRVSETREGTKKKAKRIIEVKNNVEKVIPKTLGNKAKDYEYTLHNNLKHNGTKYEKGFKFTKEHGDFKILNKYSA